MKALDLINELRGRGVEFRVQGNNVLVDAPRGAVQPDDVAALRSHKSEVLHLLADTVEPAKAAGWPALDDEAGWRSRLEYHGKRYRALNHDAGTANALANGNLLNEMHSAIVHKQPPDPTLCAGCGELLDGDVLNLGDGALVHGRDGHKCLISYGRKWRKQAADRLAQLGIDVPTELTEIQ